MNRLDQRGFTLVELTLSVVMLAVLSIAAIIFMVSGIRSYSFASAKANLLGQAQFAMDRISNDIMLSASADAYNSIDDSNSPVVGNPLGWQSDADTLVLATAAENQNREILFADASKYISHKNNFIYYLDGSTLRKRVLAADVADNRAMTTCPPALASVACPADGVILQQVVSFTLTYRNHLNQVVQPDEARSVQVSVTLKDRAYGNAEVSYETRTVFRND